MEPVGAPICWGKQFGDEDDECKNCKFSESCRPATINNYANRNQVLPQPRYTLPVIQQQPPPQFQPRFGTPQLPQQSILPQPQQSNYPRTVLPHPPIPQTQAPIGFQPHAPAGWNTPIAYLPRPNPNNQAWWQYQGEATGTRLGKNLLLSALQAIFSELLRFFANWTWPTSLSTT